ncbi:hypothetical protein F994_02782 [Acinetobacter bohemicus ANC 3994]|uniref:Uncharacterized protein n=1 Tax=Acinetobacter bohemicus ANC 3994 TaxID=1217715 RepID=N8NWV4_9GAMM|nr:hypothetical protein [Acinetobacter bohemicus]ENU18655.1 hypothetical protein F994_02782 [Acinetobacter bohemicus ANC 3994]
MNFEQIACNLKLNEWKKVGKTNEYISKSDIYLRFKSKEAVGITLEALPENIKTFYDQLEQSVDMNSIESIDFEFRYDEQLIDEITIYHFSCNLKNITKHSRSVYFGKALNTEKFDHSENLFYFALIKLLNNESGMSLVLESNGKLL